MAAAGRALCSARSADVARCLNEAARDPSRVVIEGFHALKHALRFGAAIEAVFVLDPAGSDKLADTLAPDLRARLSALATPVAAKDFADYASPPPPTGVIAIAHRPTSSPADILARADAPVVLLEEPRHLGNLGAAIRVAAACGAAGLMSTGPADPWHGAALRGAAGLQFALPVTRLHDWASLPPDRLVALDPDGQPLAPGLIADDAILAFGTERAGLSTGLRAHAAHKVRIPMEPGVSSLNLATAVAVTLYAWRFGRAAG